MLWLGWFVFVILITYGYFDSPPNIPGMLYPRESETREIKSLDGIWNFRLSPENDPLLGIRQKWFENDLSKSGDVIPMPVPSSYNDITQDKEIRDHIGVVWYDRTFFVPERWNTTDLRVWLRFGSVSYAAQVYLNGRDAMRHEIGHLPFERDVSSMLIFGALNRITVACDNTLLQETVPQGTVGETTTDEGTRLFQSYTFDFFNYAGIHRPVLIYTTPRVYISDINIDTHIDGTAGIITYAVIIENANEENTNYITVYIKLFDKYGQIVVEDTAGVDFKGVLTINDAKLWWPYLMNDDPGYLYTMEITLSTVRNRREDVYRLPVGIRTIHWTNTSLLINGENVYLRGFGRHEDSDLRGKGLDLALIAKDYNLIKWVGANCYRTSHYPYSEEVMDFADREGIMIIDECPSVDTENYSGALLGKHKASLTELIRRDKNRPGVIMWSVANEPRTQLYGADDYFAAVVQHVKTLDRTRPVTIALARGVQEDKAGKYLDIISFNRYNGWYSNPGKTNMITNRVIEEATAWNTKHNKPILMSEYGADTMEGMHMNPEFVWSEEYQVEVMSKHFAAFDQLRDKGFFIGEFIWNFADFKTAQTVQRVGGNKKGIFTRNRQPKAAAHHLRSRYHILAEEYNNVSLPHDLFKYLVRQKPAKTEL